MTTTPEEGEDMRKSVVKNDPIRGNRDQSRGVTVVVSVGVRF
ncbi:MULTISPECIES: hypothetical protein [Actinoalloteichus]|nr:MULTISPECIES: hypothetical protein [Actinoalloteichus]